MAVERALWRRWLGLVLVLGLGRWLPVRVSDLLRRLKGRRRRGLGRGLGRVGGLSVIFLWLMVRGGRIGYGR